MNTIHELYFRDTEMVSSKETREPMQHMESRSKLFSGNSRTNQDFQSQALKHRSKIKNVNAQNG